MSATLSFLQERHSFPANQLTEPAPDSEQLEQILRCGLSAPDHARLRPWRFVVIRDQARHALADVFVKAARRRDPELSEQKLDLLGQKPLRSPLIVVVVTVVTPDHPKTPVIEQSLSTGAAVQLIQLGATALGFGSIWLTGANAYDEQVKTALNIDEKDQIAGFLYLGTPPDKTPSRQRPEVSDHISHWHG
jgi:nitroreductase